MIIMIYTHIYIYLHIIYLSIYLFIYLFHPLAITSQWQRPSWGFMAFHRTFWLAEGPLQKGAPWEKPLHDKLSIFRSYDVLWADSCIQLLDFHNICCMCRGDGTPRGEQRPSEDQRRLFPGVPSASFTWLLVWM